MTGRDSFIDELMREVPRGKAWAYQRAQTPHQARWQDPAGIAKSDLLAYDPDKPDGKILTGAFGKKLIGIGDDRHILTVAGNRAGKSVTVIANLFFYNGSVLCMDPKGELAAITAVRRAALGQKVYVLDPFESVTGEAARYRARYNPVSTLKAGSRTIIEDAVQITDGLVVKSGQEKEPHWNEAAGSFLTGLILYVATGDDIEKDERHLGTVRRFVTQALSVAEGTQSYILPKRILNACDRLAGQGHEDLAAAIEGSIRGFYDKSPDELASVLSTASRHTQFLDYASMKSVLSGHDFDLQDLKADPSGVSVYLCLPATRMGMCNRWLRLILNQFLVAMETEHTKPPAPVLVCLDEFPVLGFMQQLQDAAGQIASFDVKLWAIMQDWGQGKSLYGDRFESFAANAGIFQAFGNVDLTTTEYISRRLGKTVIETARHGEASVHQREEGMSGRNVSAETFDLLSPDEVSRLFARSDPHKRQLVMWAGYHPMVLQRVEYWDKDSAHHVLFPEI